MFWPGLTVLMVAMVLAAVVWMAAYATHVRDRMAPLVRSAAGLHRAGVGRHRSGVLSVTGLRARERAEDIRMYPAGGR